MVTRSTSSTLLVSVGRGVARNHSNPTDNKGNVFTQVGVTHNYTQWPDSGTALYQCDRSTGGNAHVVSVAKPNPEHETTLSVVEVVNGGRVQDVQWSEVLSGSPLTSPSVTTTGPALLVAWWWGDAGVFANKTATPDNGFSVIDAVLLEGPLVQCAVAVRQVSAAGSYRVTWAATPQQGAQLWIAAVQSA
jgi:hypothetical protein